MSVLTLADAKTHLNITVTTWDTELQVVIDAAEAAIARRVGPLEATPVTNRVRGGGVSLLLTTLPVVSLTSVTSVDGDALDVDDLYVSPGGVVEYASATTCFPAATYSVAYFAGRATTPDDLLFAVKELVRHLWTPQRGNGSRPGAQPSTELSNTLPGSAFVFPFRVEQLLTPYVQAGFA